MSRRVAGTAARWVSDGAASSGQPQPIADSSSCTFVNLADGFSKFSDHWSPKVVGELNGFHVKIVKLEGEFDWQYATRIRDFRDSDDRSCVGPLTFGRFVCSQPPQR